MAPTLASGTRLGSYEIESLLGAGGMGEVYRARDTRLNRTVAIKVLPHDQVADRDRERRFLQEARAASALNHPHIVTLHDIVHETGIDFLVMEYVAGKSLDKLISAKRLPLVEALGYGQQMASALAAAHAAGIVHRDIKPANVIVTPEGQVKVLDFGLAKLVQRDVEDPGAETRTRAALLTEPGMVMGTAAYMSPEQANGRELDHRTDIFSLGVVLYEMLAGQRPFRGTSQVETMHAIINNPPPPLSQPLELRDILDKALAKDPKERYQHVGDLGLDLRRFLQRPLEARRASSGTERGRRLPWIAAAVLLVALPVAWWTGHRAVPTAEETAAVGAPSITPFTTTLGYNGEATIAPDNQTVAYVSDRAGRFDIYLRQIGTSADIPLTRDQGDNIQPAFSPDGRQIAFVSSRGGGTAIFYPGFDNPMMGGDIWVMPALGGTPRRVTKDGNFPSWSPDGMKIVFARNRIGLFEVAASGGDVHGIKLPSDPQVIYYPAYSTDARWVFFEDSRNSINVVPVTGGAVQQLGTGRHPVWDASAQAVIYSDSREGNNHSLWSLPFSTEHGKSSGAARPLTIGRGRDWQPAVSRDGKLVAYTAIQATFNLEAVPFDAEAGRVLGSPRVVTTGNQVSYFMRFSPDGRSIAFESSRGAGRHIWRVDISTEPVQLTADPKFEETFPQWAPDGNTIAFTRQPAQSPNAKTLWLMDPDGANPRQILEGNNLTRWLPDGSAIVYQNLKNEILLYDLATARSRQISTQPDVVSMPTPSSDGQWIVYQATGKDAGNVDVHAVRLDGGQPRVVASTPRQDFHPFFSPSGRWVYFQQDHKNIYRVPGPGQDWKRADPVRVTDFPESGLFVEDPQISRDGKQLLYARGRIIGDIWILKRGE
jgi:Tol biopolymer transport system component/tRNA A-37 threonylcarbamoyl transferase component Bud32